MSDGPTPSEDRRRASEGSDPVPEADALEQSRAVPREDDDRR
jgi:hypothetical protein